MPGTLSPSTLLATAVADDEQARAEEIATRWDRYRGDYPDTLKIESGDPDDNVKLNVTGTVVDAGVDFLFGEDLTFEIEGEGGPGSDSEREQWLNAVWDANRRMTKLQLVGMNGAISGHAVVKIQPDPGSAERPPRILVIDPATYTARWSQDDIEQVEEHRITWTIIDAGRPAVRRQRMVPEGATWTIVDEISRGDATRFETIETTTWAYPWAPIVETQNLPEPNEFYGRSDLTKDIIDANAAINGVLSDLRRTVRLHGHPLFWVSGAPGEVLDIGPGDAIELPEEGRVGAIETRSDPTALDLFERLKAALHEQARVPEIAAGKLDNVGQLSGLALQILYGPLLRKTRTKRRLYGDLLREVNRRLLELRFGAGGNSHTLIHWPDPLPTDDREAAEVAILDHQLGASRETLLERRGYSSTDEMERRASEDRESVERAAAAFDGGQGA